jgi:excisionase family DNA binding protein
VTGPILVDARQAAALLRVSRDTWLRIVARGEAPAPLKIGRLSRWRVADVERYVATLAAEGTPPEMTP